MKFQGDILNFYDFIQVFVFTTNHHLKRSGEASKVNVHYSCSIFWPATGLEIKKMTFEEFIQKSKDTSCSCIVSACKLL